MLSKNPFWSFNLALSVSAIIPLITGLCQVVQGPAFTNMLSQNLSADSMQDPTLVSQYRYLATVWLAYASFLALIMSNPPKYKAVSRIVSIHVFVGGCARLYTALKLGWPTFIYARVVVIAATILEFVLPPFFEMLLRNALSEAKAVSHSA